MPVPRPFPARLRELLDYDPEAGALHWKWRPEGPANWNARFAGERAGSLRRCDGYIRLRVDGQYFYAHLVCWAIHHGEWPESDNLDHEDLDRANNRIVNLRLASRRENEGNKPLRKDNLLGVKGVQRFGKRFRARIRAHGIRLYLGLFDTPEEASAAYERAAQRHFGEFARVA